MAQPRIIDFLIDSFPLRAIHKDHGEVDVHGLVCKNDSVIFSIVTDDKKSLWAQSEDLTFDKLTYATTDQKQVAQSLSAKIMQVLAMLENHPKGAMQVGHYATNDFGRIGLENKVYQLKFQVQRLY